MIHSVLEVIQRIESISELNGKLAYDHFTEPKTLPFAAYNYDFDTSGADDYNGVQSVQLLVVDIRPHQPEELCRQLTDTPEDVLWCCRHFCPSRNDFVSVWKSLTPQGAELPSSFNLLLSRCPDGVAPETYLICLQVWLELGLLIPGPDGSVLGARVEPEQRKINLKRLQKLMKKLLNSMVFTNNTKQILTSLKMVYSETECQIF